MTAPLPDSRRGQHRGPWTIDDDALLLDFVRQCGRLVPIGGKAAPAAVALAAELIVSLGRTASAIDTRIRGFRDRSKIGTQGAHRAGAALRGATQAANADAPLPEPKPRPAAQSPKPPPVPLPTSTRRGRDYGPRPASAPRPELLDRRHWREHGRHRPVARRPSPAIGGDVGRGDRCAARRHVRSALRPGP